MGKLEKRLQAAFLLLLLAAYGYWLLTASALSMLSAIVSAAACLLFGLLGVLSISFLLASWHGQVEVELDQGLGRRSLRRGNRHPVRQIVFTILLARVAVYMVAYILYTAQNGYHGGLLDTLSLWLKGDAPHYLGIAENWYVTTGDPRFHIVFFPLYPIVVRIVSLLTHNTFASGMLVSLVCTVFSGVLLYELAVLDLDRAAAIRAVFFQMLLPAAFLLTAPMSDSLFLLLSIACMLLARKKQYAFACILGGLAAFTRVLGVLLLVPVLVEIIGDAQCVKMQGGKLPRFMLTRLPLLLLIPTGLLLYLYINYNVTGHALTFLTYQSEHWGQRMGFFFGTAAYQTDYFLNNIVVDKPQAFGLWLPNLIYLLGAPLIMLLSQRPRKAVPPAATAHLNTSDPTAPSIPPHNPPRQPYTMRASYLCYFLAYYAVGMGATWLLSAPRYLTCCFPLPIALAGRKRLGIITLVLFAVLQAAYLWAYVSGWPVY